MTQVVLFKLSLRRNWYTFIRVSIVLQKHSDITKELVVFGEYCDDGDLKLTLDMPGMLTTAYYSCQGKCRRRTLGPALVFGYPLGRSTC